MFRGGYCDSRTVSSWELLPAAGSGRLCGQILSCPDPGPRPSPLVCSGPGASSAPCGCRRGFCHPQDQGKGVCRSQQGPYHVTLSYSQATGLSGADPSQEVLSKSEISLLAWEKQAATSAKVSGKARGRVARQGPRAASGSRQPARTRDVCPGCLETNCIFPRSNL